MTNVLVAYFSASYGATRKIAEKIAEDNSYDIFEIEPKEKYTSEDLDWTNSQSRSTKEMNDKSFRPPIAKSIDVGEYDTIIIGFPVWWYTAPSIINTFIESTDMENKQIKCFCTSGGSGIDKCVDDLAGLYPNLNFKKGLRLTGSESNDKIKEWISE